MRGIVTIALLPVPLLLIWQHAVMAQDLAYFAWKLLIWRLVYHTVSCPVAWREHVSCRRAG